MKKTLTPLPLKIGVVVDQLLPGGVQTAAIAEVKELRRLGHRVRLLILMRNKCAHDFADLVKGVPHQYLSDSYPRFLRRTVKLPVFSFLSTLHLLSPFFISRIIRPKEYDVLISHGTTTCLTTLALWRKNRIPYLAVIHDPMVYILNKCYAHTWLKHYFRIIKPIAEYLERSFVQQAQTTVIDSQMHQRYLHQKYRIKPVILPLGCQALNTPPSSLGNAVLSFGRWQKEKNPEFVLRLMQSFPNTKLILAGTWTNQSDYHAFRRKIKDWGQEDQVTLIPAYDNRLLHRLCRQSRLWVHAHIEAFGLSALEAAGHGLPVIIPAKSGVNDIFRHQIHGYFPSRLTIPSYRRYLSRLLHDRRLARRMGYQAWKVINEHFSWKAHAQRLLQLIVNHRTHSQTLITILETGHSIGTSLSGGDKLMDPIVGRLAHAFRFQVIVPRIGAFHWTRNRHLTKLFILPPNRFDGKGQPVPVFLSYLIRIRQTYQLLVSRVKSGLIYSSTNILPDVFPAYLYRRRNHHLPWVARVHHLIPPPWQRPGRMIVNIIAYLMQLTALTMIKHRSDLTIALNPGLKKKLVQIGFPHQKLVTLGAGVDFERIQQISAPTSQKYDAVYLGRLHPTKGLFDTVPIWQEVVRRLPRAQLAIIGDGPPEIKTTLIENIRQAQLAQHVHVLGYLPEKKVIGILKKAKLFLFLDHEAGWGLAVAEAMACKLPVIGYDIGVLNHIYQKGFLVVKPKNRLLFAQHIITLLQSPSLRSRLSQDAYRQARWLSWDTSADAFQKIIHRVTGHP